jgi:hypothetical protein
LKLVKLVGGAFNKWNNKTADRLAIEITLNSLLLQRNNHWFKTLM